MCCQPFGTLGWVRGQTQPLGLLRFCSPPFILPLSSPTFVQKKEKNPAEWYAAVQCMLLHLSERSIARKIDGAGTPTNKTGSCIGLCSKKIGRVRAHLPACTSTRHWYLAHFHKIRRMQHLHGTRVVLNKKCSTLFTCSICIYIHATSICATPVCSTRCLRCPCCPPFRLPLCTRELLVQHNRPAPSWDAISCTLLRLR